MHLVITSRREPPLPLSRWRMRGRMAELHDHELRFTGDEVTAFLNDTMGLALDPSQSELLNDKTEGWIGGLQLAALSLQRHEDRDAFLSAFAGDDRYVMDYLTAEVLGFQPPEVRSFLLRTSVLERMNVPLCEAVSGRPDCAEILDRLERERIFVVALDGHRSWYRYHHLFAGLLRHQLASSETESASACHRAASAWYEAQGELVEAVRHARLGEDPDCIGRLIETHGLDMILRGRSKQLRTWVHQVPVQALAEYPRRLDIAAWCEYIRTGQIPDSLRRRIEVAQHEPGAGVLLDSSLVVSAFEAARDPGRYAEAIELASKITNKGNDASYFHRLNANAISVCCAHALGEVVRPETEYARVVAEALGGHGASQFFFMSLGRGRLCALREGPVAARRSFEEALARAAERGWDGLPVSATLRYGLALQLYEMGELEACEATFEQALSLAENEPTTTRHPLYLALARLHHAQGRAEACEAMLRRQSEEPFIVSLLPIVPDLGVERAWLDLARGQLDAVQAFLESHGGVQAEGLTGIHGVRDAADLLLGRYLLLRHELPRAIAALTQTLNAAVAAGRLDTVVRSRVDLAAARYVDGQRQQAFAQLDAAVDAALGRDAAEGRPRGYHRVFVEAPPSFQSLMAARLEAGNLDEGRRSFLERLSSTGAGGDSPAPRPVQEPLSPSERKVLELLVGGLSNKEIAQGLFISPNTVKTHIRRIYGKLNARNRADAIRRAQRLGIGRA
jgi:LuxR family maltose regulon positive regulatory protein